MQETEILLTNQKTLGWKKPGVINLAVKSI